MKVDVLDTGKLKKTPKFENDPIFIQYSILIKEFDEMTKKSVNAANFE